MYACHSYKVYTSGKFDPNLNSKERSDWTKRNPISLLNDQLKSKFVTQCCPVKYEVRFSDIFQGNFSYLQSLQTSLFLLQNMSKGILDTSSHSTIWFLLGQTTLKSDTPLNLLLYELMYFLTVKPVQFSRTNIEGSKHIVTLKKEFIGPGLHLRPVHADHAQPPFQWTLNSVFSAYENNSRRIRTPQNGGTLKIISRLLIA